MSVAANDIFQVTAVGQCFGQLIMLTHYYAVTATGGGISEATASNELIDKIRAGGGGADVWETAYTNVLATEYTLDYWRAQKIAPVRYVGAIQNRGIAGTSGHGALTANTQGSVTFRTVLSGRDQVATKHVGPLGNTATVMEGGLLKAATQAALVTLATAMRQVIVITAGGTTFEPCIFHKAPPGSYTLINSALVGDTTRVQRRRTVGLGK